MRAEAAGWQNEAWVRALRIPGIYILYTSMLYRWTHGDADGDDWDAVCGTGLSVGAGPGKVGCSKGDKLSL